MFKKLSKVLSVILAIMLVIVFIFTIMLAVTNMYVFKENGVVYSGYVTSTTILDLTKYEPIGSGYDRTKDTGFIVYHMLDTVSTNTITVYDRPPKDLVFARNILWSIFPSLKSSK